MSFGSQASFKVEGASPVRTFLTKVENIGVWLDGLLDAHIAEIPKTDGDATTGRRPLRVLSVVHRIGVSAGMGQLEDWFRSWVPESVFSAANGRGSVVAWYSSSLDIEEVLTGAADSDIHLFVPECLPGFEILTSNIMLMLGCVFSLRLAFREPRTRDGGISKGCPLRMMFIVAMYLPWCRYLSAQEGVEPQLNVDDLMCVSGCLLYSCVLLGSLLVMFVLVGQELAPGKCFLLNTRAVRKEMKDWVLSQEGDQWSVRFDVRDLGGRLYATFRGWSATLASRVRLVIEGWFSSLLGRVVRPVYLPAALHGIEASLLASDSLRKLRSSIHRVVWSRRQPLAGVGAALSLLDLPTGCDPAFCVVWFRFRLLRRYLALWPAEVGRVYRLLKMVGKGSPGHGSIHCKCC